MKTKLLFCLFILLNQSPIFAQLGITGTTIAGGNGTGLPNKLRTPAGVFVDGNGNVYVADVYNNRVQKWAVGATQGVTVAGGNGYGNANNQLAYPNDVYVNASGDVFVLDVNNYRVQKWVVGATQGTTVAGGNGYGSANNQLKQSYGFYVLTNGDMYISDAGNNRIQKWLAGAVTGFTVAGTGVSGSGSNQLYYPIGIFVQTNGDMYIADNGNHRVQKWLNGATSGTTVAGGNGYGSGTNQVGFPYDVTVDVSGNVFVSDKYNYRVMKWSVGATVGISLFSANVPDGLFLDASNNLYVVESGNHLVNKLASPYTLGGVIVAGGNGSEGGANQLSNPTGIFVDATGNTFIADSDNHRIQKWTVGATAGITVAGNGIQGSSNNQLSFPNDVFVDNSGNIYISDGGGNNNRIQKWVSGATSGITVAGGNGYGSANNQLSNPNSIFVVSNGDIYICDASNHRVQKWVVGANSGITVAGGNGSGSASNQLYYPKAIFLNATGDIFVSDNFNSRVQKWTVGATTGITVAGGNGNGGNPNQLASPQGIYVDAGDNIYIASYGTNSIIKWNAGATQGVQLAGGFGSSNSQLNSPNDVFLDNAGSIYVSELNNARVQKFSTATSIAITTPTNICNGSVTCTPNGFFNAGNTFQVLLSDASGNFPATPTIIGTSANANIGVSIPSSYASGSNYKVKVVSTNPVLSSPESGVFSYLGQIAIAVSSQTICAGADVALTATNVTGATYQWRLGSTDIVGATSNTYSASAAGNYGITITLNGCIRSYNFSINPSTRTGANSLDNYTYFNGGTTANQSQYFQPFNTCNNSILLTASHLTSGTTYQWQKEGVDISGATASTYNANQSGYYTLKITQNTCTGISQPTALRINSVNIPTIFGGNTNICTGSTHNLSGSNLSGIFCCGSDVSYQWQKDGIDVVGANNGFSYTTNSSGNYTLKVTQGTCTATSIPSKVTFGTNPLISPDLSSVYTENTCASSSSISVFTNNLSGLTYQWIKDGVNITGATSSNYTPTQSGKYQARITQGTCSALSNISQQIIGELSTVSVFGNTQFCNTNTTQASLSCSPNCASFTYQWKKSGVIIAGATASTYLTNVPGVYTVEVTKGSKTVSSNTIVVYENCSTTTTTTTSLPLPYPYINGSSYFVCAGSGTRLIRADDYSTSYPGISYRWYKDDVLIAGQNRRFLSTDQPGVYRVQLMQGSLQSAISTQSVTLVSSGTVGDSFSATGLNACTETVLSTQLPTSTGLNPYSYQWKNTGVAISGATNYNYVATASGSYSVDIQLGSCTVQTSPQNVVIGTLNSNILFSPTTKLCDNGYAYLYVPSITNATYQWSKDNVVIPNLNLSFIYAHDAGAYTVAVSQGACTNTSATATSVTGTSGLFPVIGFNGGFGSTSNLTLSSCTGAINTFYVRSNSNSESRWSYQWKNGSTPIAGATASTYQPTGSGVYSADITAAGGCLLTSPQLTYTEGSIPSATFISTNSLSGPFICSGNTAVLNAGYANFNTYQWYKDDLAIAGATSPVYVANQSGGYRALLTQGSCSVFTSYQAITTNTTTIEPRITSVGASTDASCNFTGGSLSIGSLQGASYQWQKNGVDIVGANSNFYSPVTFGTYRINVVQGSCTGTSNSVEMQGGGAVTLNPNGTTLCGESGGLSASVSGTGSATYQWKLNGINTGTNSTFLGVNTLGSYTLTVTRSTGCTVTSQPFVVSAFNPMETSKTGIWNNPSVWTCGRIPNALDNVKVNNAHIVSLPATSTYFIKSINNYGNVQFNNSSNLRVGF